MKKIFRTINEDYKEMEWNMDNTIYRNINKCHWGQQKLFYSELEFFTICSKNFDLEKCICVYIGAAPGNHIKMYRNLFPNLHFILYDPRAFKIKSDDFVEIYTGTDGFFSNEKIVDIKKNKKTQNKKILFISDIRFTSNEYSFEKNVQNDMIVQQKWAILIDSEMCMLKFRLPYLELDTTISNDYNYDDIIDKVDINGQIIKDNKHLLYLDGELFTQIRANVNSTETRLISRKYNNKYILKSYDIKKYESQCFYFNNIDRLEQYEYRDSAQLKNHLAGFNNSYDCICEFFIYCKYQKYYLKKQYNFEEIVKLIYYTHNDLYKLTYRTIIGCELDTIMSNNLKKKYRANIEENKNLINMIKKKSMQLIYECNKQKDIFRKQNILSKEEYHKQIKLLEKNIIEIKRKRTTIVDFLELKS